MLALDGLNRGQNKLRRKSLGFSTDAHCFACGYDTHLMLGGGRKNFKTFAGWPVSCGTCSSVTTANFKASPLACTSCGDQSVKPMASADWWMGDGERIENWGALFLTDGHYRCPCCGKFELRFGTNVGGHDRIRWD